MQNVCYLPDIILVNGHFMIHGKTLKLQTGSSNADKLEELDARDKSPMFGYTNPLDQFGKL